MPATMGRHMREALLRQLPLGAIEGLAHRALGARRLQPSSPPPGATAPAWPQKGEGVATESATFSPIITEFKGYLRSAWWAIVSENRQLRTRWVRPGGTEGVEWPRWPARRSSEGVSGPQMARKSLLPKHLRRDFRLLQGLFPDTESGMRPRAIRLARMASQHGPAPSET